MPINISEYAIFCRGACCSKRRVTLVVAVSASTSVKATLLPVVPVLPASVYLLVITLRACYRSFCTSCPAKRIRHYGLVKAGI